VREGRIPKVEHWWWWGDDDDSMDGHTDVEAEFLLPATHFNQSIFASLSSSARCPGVRSDTEAPTPDGDADDEEEEVAIASHVTAEEAEEAEEEEEA
jgi:hypothetical protein